MFELALSIFNAPARLLDAFSRSAKRDRRRVSLNRCKQCNATDAENGLCTDCRLDLSI